MQTQWPNNGDNMKNLEERIIKKTENEDIKNFILNSYKNNELTVTEISRYIKKKFNTIVCTSLITPIAKYYGLSERPQDLGIKIKSRRVKRVYER